MSIPDERRIGCADRREATVESREATGIHRADRLAPSRVGPSCERSDQRLDTKRPGTGRSRTAGTPFCRNGTTLTRQNRHGAELDPFQPNEPRGADRPRRVIDPTGPGRNSERHHHQKRRPDLPTLLPAGTGSHTTGLRQDLASTPHHA